jgi:hypothetical protein
MMGVGEMQMMSEGWGYARVLLTQVGLIEEWRPDGGRDPLRLARVVGCLDGAVERRTREGEEGCDRIADLCIAYPP